MNSIGPPSGFRGLPLQGKVGLVAGVTTAIALIVTLSGVMLVELRRAPRDLEAELTSVLSSTAGSVSPMLFFDSGRAREEAAEQLGYLSAFPSIEEAWLVDDEGSPFAEFRKSSHSESHRMELDAEGSEFRNGYVLLRKDIYEAGTFQGVLYIEANLDRIRSLRNRYLFGGAIAALLGFMVSALVVHPLRLWLTRPILALARVAERVKAEGRHDLRAQRTTRDEVGSLVDAFNEMLEAVQNRETDLQIARTEAERLADDRARQADELKLAYSQLMDEMNARKRLQEQLLHAQKMESIGQLAGGIAHDFNNLLTVILGWTEYASTGHEDVERMREGLEQIQRSGERAATLARQLLAFARRQVIRPEIIEINALIGEMTQLIASVLGDGVTIQLELAVDAATVLVDPGQLEQILLNMAINARDAMPDGGTFTIQTRNEDPSESLMEQFELARERSYVRITLRDTGTGIPLALRDKIFEPFFTTKEKGTGLGLAMCYGIVRQSDGCVTFDSRPGQGTSFIIFLPVAADQGDATEGAPHGYDEVMGSETILVVEDEAAVRTLIDRSLRQFGYTVHAARDDAEAVRLAEEHLERLDLLITDLKMPGLGGHALLAELRLRRPKLPALLISGFDANLSGSAALGEGVTFLQKPFTPTALARAAREALQGATTQSSHRKGAADE